MLRVTVVKMEPPLGGPPTTTMASAEGPQAMAPSAQLSTVATALICLFIFEERERERERARARARERERECVCVCVSLVVP